MSAPAISPPMVEPGVTAERAGGVGARLRWYLDDVIAVAGRNFRLIRRDPVGLVFLTVQPALFVLLFTVVFGRALEMLLGVAYIQYLLPGIFAQTVCFGAMGTGIGVATDLRDGLVERFRSLPMAPSAVLVGRTVADLARNAWAVLTMLVMGWLLGFEVWGSAVDFLFAIGALLLLGFALEWTFLLIGLSGRPERVFAVAFPVLMPLVFISSAFVPVDLLPEWIQGFARSQPVSQAIEGTRVVALGGFEPAYILNTIWWSLGILTVTVVLSVWRFRRAR